MSIRVGHSAEAPEFPAAAKQSVANTQLRHNVRHATGVIRKQAQPRCRGDARLASPP